MGVLPQPERRRLRVKKVPTAVTVAAAVAALSSGLTVVASAHPEAGQSATATGAKLHWGSCQDAELAAFNAQCALLSVPLDYAHPDRKHIKIAVSRIRHTSSDADSQ